jgi:hypothetical protein
VIIKRVEFELQFPQRPEMTGDGFGKFLSVGFLREEPDGGKAAF